MSLLRSLVARVLALFRGRRYDRELDDEVLAHLELAERDALDAGMSPEDARREARLRFGGIDVMTEEHRDRRSARWIETLGKDVRYAFRSLRRDRTFTAVAVAVLTLAIGAGTIVFSVVDAVVLRGLPFDEHDRLAAVQECYDVNRGCASRSETTPQTFLDWRRQQQSFDAIAAVERRQFRVKLAAGPPAEIEARVVSHELFGVLRVVPMLGRPFTPEDETDDRRLVILSHGFWLRVFGGDPSVIGRTLDVDEYSWEVVGVMPPGFSYPVSTYPAPEIYAPLQIRAADSIRDSGRSYLFAVVGRLRDHVTLAQAGTDIAAITSRLAADFPDWFEGRVTSVVALRDHLVGRVRSWMLLLLGAVVVVLLIACANLANLMLARSTVRAREGTIRAALGASRWRLIRTVMIEGLVLSLIGAALGIVVAYIGVSLVTSWLPVDLPRAMSVAVDLRVLTATSLAAVVTGIVFSIAPALQSSNPDLNTALRDGGRSVVSRAGERIRAGLVVVEIGFAVFLVIGASLFIGSVVKWLRIDLGFDHRNLIAMSIAEPPDQRALDEALLQGDAAVRAYNANRRERHAAFARQFVSAIDQVPGVVGSAVVAGGLPLTRAVSSAPIEVPDRGVRGNANWRQVSSGYASVLGLALVEGRYLAAADVTSAEQVAVVNESAVRAWWPGESPLGRRMTWAGQERVVVGVVSDVRHLGPEQPARPEIHMLMEGRWTSASLLVRTSRDPNDVLPLVRAAVLSVNPEQLIVGDVFTLEGYADRLVAQRRFTMGMFALLGITGLVIAAAGVYGVMAYTVSQRRQEIGVRMALGARPADVVSMVLGRSLTLVVMGLTIGTAGAWYASSAVETFLFELSPTDTRIYAIAIATIGPAGILASIVPARRAAKVDPLVALRAE